MAKTPRKTYKLPESKPVNALAMTPIPRPRAKRKLDETKQAEICAMMTVGTSVRMAARLTGVSPQAVRQLALRDPVFLERMRQSQTLSQITPLKTIFVASKTHWRAAAWLLERLNRHEFGRINPEIVTKAELEGLSEEIAAGINASIPDPKTRKMIHRACRKARRPDRDLFAR